MIAFTLVCLQTDIGLSLRYFVVKISLQGIHSIGYIYIYFFFWGGGINFNNINYKTQTNLNAIYKGLKIITEQFHSLHADASMDVRVGR